MTFGNLRRSCVFRRCSFVRVIARFGFRARALVLRGKRRPHAIVLCITHRRAGTCTGRGAAAVYNSALAVLAMQSRLRAAFQLSLRRRVVPPVADGAAFDYEHIKAAAAQSVQITNCPWAVWRRAAYRYRNMHRGIARYYYRFRRRSYSAALSRTGFVLGWPNGS